MSDVMKPEQRRRAMAANRGRTKPEMALARALFARGLRYYTSPGFASRTGRLLPGKPDLIFPRRRVVVFVDGCFWHGCALCGKARDDMSEFWRLKIKGNLDRDVANTDLLAAEGWIVVRIWEHDLRKKSKLEATADHVAALIKQRPPSRK